jgi:hypothetical protein
MIDIFKAAFGGMMLFTGRDQEWVFSLGLGLLVGLKFTFLLPEGSPLWAQFTVVAAGGAIGVLPFLVYQESSFIVTGLLFGGFTLSEYGNIVSTALIGRAFAGSTWLIFIVGAGLGAVALGLTKTWGMILATALVGAFLITGLFSNLSPVAESMIAAGLFIVGCITQAIIMRIEQQSAR